MMGGKNKNLRHALSSIGYENEALLKLCARDRIIFMAHDGGRKIPSTRVTCTSRGLHNCAFAGARLVSRVDVCK
jgi:hypothetical protein